MPNLSVNLIDTWPTYFKVGDLYRTKVWTFAKSTSYVCDRISDYYDGEEEVPPGIIFLTLDRIQRPDWNSYEIKILTGEKVCYIWFASEHSPDWYLEKVV